MDFLSRLIAGTGTSPTKQKANTPAERLATCKRICNALQQIWRGGSSLSEDDATTLHVATYVKRLAAILHDELRKAAPHSCLLYTASSQIYIIITKLALSSRNPEIIGASATFFHILINSEAEGLLDSKIFARSLVDLVRRTTGPHAGILDVKEEADLVELLFEIATKIKIDPDLLPSWFYPERDRSRTRDAASTEARKNQFPLFYMLLEFVHHDGTAGDFARTGVLYLIETASKSKSLDEWMIESDIAPQMASGLGALYSRLSRRLPSWPSGEKLPAIIALSDSSSSDLSTEESPVDFQENVKSFLSYLAFWQDTLNHCYSPELTDTLLDHFQVLFVRQLLYPSLLESSDVDGGSTASVISHLYRILDALDHTKLIQGILRYLLATENRPSREQLRRRQRMSISRRKSMDKLAVLAEISDAPPPVLFNLLDLLVLGLKSAHYQTVTATLKLVSIIISKHHVHVLPVLFKTTLNTSNVNPWYVGDLNRDLIQLLKYAETITTAGSIDQSYESLLSDTQILLEQHSCSLSAHPEIFKEPEEEYEIVINADCKVFAATMDLFRTFFGNETITNIALTEVLVSLASCRHISLRSWLFQSEHALIDSEGEPMELFTILTDHLEQIQKWRAQFPEWDSLMATRKASLSFSHETEDSSKALSPPGKIARTSSFANEPTPAAQPRPETPKPSSRPSTPRHRMIPPPIGFGSIDGTIATSPSIGASPKAYTLATSPLRQTNFAPTSSSESGGTAASTESSADMTALLETQIPLPPRHEPNSSTSTPHFASLVERMNFHDVIRSETGSAAGTSEGPSSGAVTPSMREANRNRASLSHILTNAVILQEFVLEIAAVMQIRASLFGEVEIR